MKRKSSILELEASAVSTTKALPAGWRCLVLEDEFLIALDLQEILAAAGAEVACFADATTALAALGAGAQFDLALLDIHLGGASNTSSSVAAALAARQIPFILLTGMHRQSARDLAYPDAPMLEKPYQQPELLNAIRVTLAQS